VKEDKIQIITEQNIEADAQDNLSKLFMPKHKSEFIISVNATTFVNSIIETYDSDKSVVNQFLHDFFRQIVSINDIVYENIDDLFLTLSTSNRKTSILSKSGEPMSTMMLLLLITCQSSHYLSYLYPHNTIGKVRDAAILDSEYSNDQKLPKCEDAIVKPIVAFEDPTANYFVMNSDSFNVTNIIIDEIDVRPEVGCVIESTYKIFDTQNYQKVYDIHAETIFNEKSDRCLIKYVITKTDVNTSE
jgi:hypothetical protein